MVRIHLPPAGSHVRTASTWAVLNQGGPGHRHLCRQAIGAGRSHPQRPRSHRIPQLSAVGGRRAGRRARRQDHGTEERLELRADRHPQPPAEAVRRCPRTAGADLGARPLAQRPGIVENRDCSHRRRHRLPRLAIGRHQRRAAADRRVLAVSRNHAPRQGAC